MSKFQYASGALGQFLLCSRDSVMKQQRSPKRTTGQPRKPKSSARISNRMVSEALSSAEQRLEWCIGVVGILSGYKSDIAKVEDIRDFQLRLYEIISDVEQVYRVIKREEKRLIGRKSSYNSNWFNKRMSQLAGYSQILREGLTLARAVGDGFAWFFYERDPQIIEQHLKHQPQILLPPDLGGAGERLLLENLRSGDGKFLLYHGITSVLRIGDFSFIDITSLRVVGLAELKTSRIDPQRINLSLSIISGEKDLLPKFYIPAEIDAGQSQFPVDSRALLSASMRARLVRQMDVMEEAIASAKKVRNGLEVSEDLEFHYHHLEEVVRRSHSGGFEYVKAGEGLVIAAWRMPGPRPYGVRETERRIASTLDFAADLPAWAMKILDPDSEWNSLAVGVLGGEARLKPRSIGLPFFSWPVDPAVLSDIAFERVIVVTLYNPAHLIKRLHSNGYEIELGENGKLVRATKQLGQTHVALENYDCFLSLVPWTLMTEHAVMTIIEQTLETSMTLSQGKRSAKVEFVPVIRRGSAREDFGAEPVPAKT